MSSLSPLKAQVWVDRTTLLHQSALVLVAGLCGVLVAAQPLWAVCAVCALVGIIAFPIVRRRLPKAGWALLFCIFIFADHQFRSIFLLPVSGVEIQPREIALGIFLSVFCITLVHSVFSQPNALRVPPAYDMHLGILLLIGYFVSAGFIGILQGNDMRMIIADARVSPYLLAYPAFLFLVRTRREMHFLLIALFVLSAAIALAALMFFAYATLTGGVISVQNHLGEFVRREFGPFLVQSVRPNGHWLWEVTWVVLFSLIISGLRAKMSLPMLMLLIGLLVFFSAAIFVEFMRTAYVSVAVSTLVLLGLYLPVRFHRLGMVFAFAVVVAGAAAFFIHYRTADVVPTLDKEVSIKAREMENIGAVDALAEHPWWGLGLGGTFRSMDYVWPGRREVYTEGEFKSLHNSFLQYFVKGGILAAGLAVSGLALVIASAYRILEQKGRNPWENALLRGILAAFVGQCAASLTLPRLSYAHGLVFTALCAALFARWDTLAPLGLDTYGLDTEHDEHEPDYTAKVP
jgi:hypothetical protein